MSMPAHQFFTAPGEVYIRIHRCASGVCCRGKALPDNGVRTANANESRPSLSAHDGMCLGR
ncbi:MAG: hypothetical protein IPN76_05200 [Saprospiraceae bacterium]|nr:hypothetical protein [Saprospiraceae bacterium]